MAAGVDIPLICNNPDKAFSARERIYRAVQAGELSEDRIRKSLSRISGLKARYATSMQPADLQDARDYFHM